MRRYDKSQFNGRKPNQQKPGPKPLYLKQMSRNCAAKTLKAFEGIASWEDIFKRAWEKGDYTLCASIRFRCEDRLYGKPFMAENPEAKGKGNVTINGSWLQVAIQQLLPSSATSGVQKPPRTRRKALPSAVPVEASPDVQAKCLHFSELQGKLPTMIVRRLTARGLCASTVNVRVR